MHNAIRRRTREAFGAPIPPHWFRDAAVTFLVRDEPASARLAGSILGHSSPEIANRHYNQALMIDSARRHVERDRIADRPKALTGPKTQETLGMRAVIYARYSSDLQRETSIEDQIEVCRHHADARGWTILRQYSDRAASGSTKFRPGYQDLLAAARRREFDVVLAEALDRLSRDQEDVAALFKTLTFHGVQLMTLAEGAITELHVGFKGTMNALFLKDLSAKTHRGMRGRIKEKRAAGGLSYGYAVKRETDAKGEPVRGGRVINPDEAAIVRRIFAEFAGGASPRAIAKRLNGERTPGPGGRPWQDTTIRGHAERGTGVLRNELYAGRLVWNRQRFVKDPSTGKRQARRNPRAEWIVEEVPELRIIDEALWERVGSRLNALAETPTAVAIRESRFWEKRRARHILTGLAVCGRCGRPLAAVGRDYLRCAQADRNGLCDNRRGVRRKILEDLVLTALQKNLMHPDLVAEFIRAYQAEVNAERGPRSRNALPPAAGSSRSAVSSTA